MEAPSGTSWSEDYVNSGKGRIGIYLTSSNTQTQTMVTAEIWFWTQYSCNDSSNNFYMDWSSDARTNIGSIFIDTSNNIGSGWSTNNQVFIGRYEETFDRWSSDRTLYFSTRFSNIEYGGGNGSHSVSFIVPAKDTYILTFDPNEDSVGIITSKTITNGFTYGDFPTLTKDGYKFEGWYTSPSDGTKVLGSDIVSVTSDITLYAHWSKEEATIPTENEGIKDLTVEKFQTIEPISLDIYNTNIKTINAKQLDSKSRYVRVSCTEHGKKIELDANTMSAFIRYKRPDGKAVLDMCTILSDGTLIFELTQQMLQVSGKAVADIMLFGAKIVIDNSDGDVELPEDTMFLNGLVVDYDKDKDNVSVTYNQEKEFVHKIHTIEDLENMEELKDTQLLSTMTLYVNILPTTINHAEIVKSERYDELGDMLNRLGIVRNEADKQAGEANKAAENANSVAGRANGAAVNANGAAEKADKAAKYASAKGNYANTQSGAAERAAIRANIAAVRAEKIVNNIDKIVLKNEDGKVPVDQLDIALATLNIDGTNVTLFDLISQLLSNMHKVYHGYGDPNDPNNSSVVGSKDGDIYMKIIKKDTTGTVGE